MKKLLPRIQIAIGVAGLGLLVYAAWRINHTAGIAALGVALLIIDWRLDQ